MKIAIVSAFYSDGMGYSENCLSKALASLHHDVHVITSTFNVYGNDPAYDKTYREFLGPAQVKPGTSIVDCYTVHRLESNLVSGYVNIKGLVGKVRELAPDIVHSLEIASLQTFELAAAKPFTSFKLFTETHQCMSVMKPYMRYQNGKFMKRAVYRATRTLPTWLASLAVETCYAVTPDCAEVAERFYGVSPAKMKMQPLGTDTETFHPVESEADRVGRQRLRQDLGYSDSDIICVYTGRFSRDKHPLLLAKAIDAVSRSDPRYKGLFIGDGVEKAEISGCRNTMIRPFLTHRKLAEHYRAADIAVWPRQESMSMLDAAASGVPVIGSNNIGAPDRVLGNGKMYEENNVESMVEVLRSFSTREERRRYGDEGRRKMLEGFSWIGFARSVEADFARSLGAA